ncbi:MAG: 23S rRNA (pseudouridine(1915)-N(3))-methyltransferase RlmH [Janthinobacterium lividum]
MPFRITLLTVRSAGSQATPLSALSDQYLQRCSRSFVAESKVLRTEAALLTAVTDELKGGAGAFWIADLGGRSLTTDDFASRVRLARDGGLRHLMLAVGPADGWSAEARSVATLRLALGAMTLPHELAALVLAEQIYRVSTILQGHPYHLGH